MRTSTFNGAWKATQEFLVQQGARLGTRRIAVRDLLGRIRLVLDDVKIAKKADRDEAVNQVLQGGLQAFRSELGPYAATPLVIPIQDLLAPEKLFRERSLTELAPQTYLLDHPVTGQEWTTRPSQPAGASPRATLFGLKGGVGRSTATALLARHLAAHGRRILVVDLDLEAPGLSSFLVGAEDPPEVGVLDWLVEDAVGQGDVVLHDLVRRVPNLRDGDILVVPTAATREEYYVQKLGRVFVEVPRPGTTGVVETFADRIARLLGSLEEIWRPDGVLLDARAGLHDLSAASLVHLQAENLLFAVDSPQTWAGYNHMFGHWHRGNPDWESLRQRLQFVMAQTPELNRARYIESFRDHAYEIMARHCYDELLPGQVEGFHPDRGAEEAPHIGFPIGWSPVFQVYDPHGTPPTPEQVEASYGAFFRDVESLLWPKD